MNDSFDLRIITQPHSQVYWGYFRRLVLGNSSTKHNKLTYFSNSMLFCSDVLLPFSHIPRCIHAKTPDFPRLFEPRECVSLEPGQRYMYATNEPTKQGGFILSGFYGKRQGTLKNDSEWRTARRMRFAIKCSPRRFPFAAPFPIYFSNIRYSMFAAPFAIRRAVRHSPRHQPRHSPFAKPFPIHFPIFRYSMFAAPLAIRNLPFANRRAIRRAIRCPLTLSIGFRSRKLISEWLNVYIYCMILYTTYIY